MRWEMEYACDKIAFSRFPSGERGFRYGMKFMDATDHQDLMRAEYFFSKTVHIDPVYPRAHYQLARIAFLRNELVKARVYADEEIALQGEAFDKPFYIRALAYGFSGQYDAAGRDFLTFLRLNPHGSLNWSAMNDYAWVMLKGGHVDRALHMLVDGMQQFPENPWLMNEYAVALYETQSFTEAETWARRAEKAVSVLTEDQFVRAYSGNGYAAAPAGMAAFKAAVASNLAKIEVAIGKK